MDRLSFLKSRSTSLSVVSDVFLLNLRDDGCIDVLKGRRLGNSPPPPLSITTRHHTAISRTSLTNPCVYFDRLTIFFRQDPSEQVIENCKREVDEVVR